MTTESDPPERRPRNAIRLLVSADFGAFFLARLFTSTSTWLFSLVSVVAAFEITRSALFVGLVTAAQFIPQIALGPLSGTWADRGNIKVQMIIGRILLAASSLTLALWYFLHPDVQSGGTDVVLLATSLVFGVGLVVGGPALQSAPPLLVSRAELPTAMALNTAPMTVGRILGPILGAIATTTLGYASSLAIGAALHLVFVALIATIRFPNLDRRGHEGNYGMREALRFARHHRRVLLSLVGVTAVGLASEPFMTLAPLLTASFGGGPETTGTLVTSIGVGAAIGVVFSSLLTRRFEHRHLAMLGMSAMAGALALCVLPLAKPWLLCAFALSGFGFIVAHSGLSTILQLQLPPLLRGRIMALWLIGFVGARPLGAVTVGTIADVSNAQMGFAGACLLMLTAIVLCRPSNLRDTDAPER